MTSRTRQKPELLAPVGNPEKLRVAVRHGADAVYLGGQRYGLRAMAENFSKTELQRGVEFAKKFNVKVYVTLNAFLHDNDMEGLGEYAAWLESIGVSAGIISDLGVIDTVQAHSSLPIHLSTQASCLNSESAKFWRDIGVERVIVGRELTIQECSQIAERAQIEVETFIHGAMCMAYSGNCTISNFTAGRDSNRGGCIQSCRFHYEHTPVKDFRGSSLPVLGDSAKVSNSNVGGYFMSSRDQMGVRLIPQILNYNIASLKIEGRMKSVFYLATLCRVYRRVLDACFAGETDEELFLEAERELRTVPHRDYFGGNLNERARTAENYEHDGTSATAGTQHYLGLVIDTTEDWLAVRLARKLEVRDTIEFLLPHSSDRIQLQIAELFSPKRELIEFGNQEAVVLLRRTEELVAVQPYSVISLLPSRRVKREIHSESILSAQELPV